jgi:hypothetical protein
MAHVPGTVEPVERPGAGVGHDHAAVLLEDDLTQAEEVHGIGVVSDGQEPRGGEGVGAVALAPWLHSVRARGLRVVDTGAQEQGGQEDRTEQPVATWIRSGARSFPTHVRAGG